MAVQSVGKCDTGALQSRCVTPVRQKFNFNGLFAMEQWVIGIVRSNILRNFCARIQLCTDGGCNVRSDCDIAVFPVSHLFLCGREPAPVLQSV
jgi:hypothetical protein